MPVRRLRCLPGDYAVARLAPATPVPVWADGEGFVSITRTQDELSIVCRAGRVPAGIPCSGPWTCFQLQGPFAFDEAGVVLEVIKPVSENGIGIFVVSTYDGDHILIQQQDVLSALALWQAAGHEVSAALEAGS